MAKEAWRASLRPRIRTARSELADVDPGALVRRGGLRHVDGKLHLRLLGTTYGITWPELTVMSPDGSCCSEELSILVLDYLCRADGSLPTGEWVGFQELPDGAFYRAAFQGYSGDRLVRVLGGDVNRFRTAATVLDGEPLPMGDAGFAFRVLPHVPMAVVWWNADEEFSAHATVLFDRIADRYLPTDGLAILGRMLCSALAEAGEAG